MEIINRDHTQSAVDVEVEDNLLGMRLERFAWEASTSQVVSRKSSFILSKYLSSKISSCASLFAILDCIVLVFKLVIFDSKI